MRDRYEIFTRVILNISKNIQKIKNREMEKFGLKGKQVQFFFLLYRNPEGLEFKELCALSGTDKAAVSRTVKELCALSYVYTEKNPQKKYKNPVRLTPKGMMTGDKIDGIIENVVNFVSGGISEEERENLYAMLNLIDENLNKYCKGKGE